MNTIEERAEKAFPRKFMRDGGASQIGYIQGATEQRKIDIDKACELMCKFCNGETHVECIYRRNHGEPNVRCMRFAAFKYALEEQ